VGPGGLKVRAPGPNLSKGPQLICDATDYCTLYSLPVSLSIHNFTSPIQVLYVGLVQKER